MERTALQTGKFAQGPLMLTRVFFFFEEIIFHHSSISFLILLTGDGIFFFLAQFTTFFRSSNFVGYL